MHVGRGRKITYMISQTVPQQGKNFLGCKSGLEKSVPAALWDLVFAKLRHSSPESLSPFLTPTAHTEESNNIPTHCICCTKHLFLSTLIPRYLRLMALDALPSLRAVHLGQTYSARMSILLELLSHR